VAIGTEGGLGDAAGEGLAMDTGTVLIDDFVMAHAASIGDGGAEGLGLGGNEFMGAAMTEGAIGSAFIAGLTSLAVNAAGVIAGLIRVAGCADRLGNAGGMRILFVGIVTGFAGEPGMSALFELLSLLMAGRALRRGRGIGGLQAGAGRSQQKPEQGRTEPDTQKKICPVPHGF